MSGQSGAPIPFFTPANTAPAYQLRYHFGWHTYSKRPILAQPELAQPLQLALTNIARDHEWHLLSCSTEPTQLNALVSLRPETPPSAVTRIAKGNLASHARPYLGGDRLWSRGWFVRSNGHVTNETVRNYVANQFLHHDAAPFSNPTAISLARFHADTIPNEMRAQSHSAFEYNVHVVFVTRRRLEFLDLEVAEFLLQYLLRICAHKRWVVHDIEVVWNHVHLFLGLQPTDAPGDVAISLMNNTAFALHRRYPGAIRSESLAGIWCCGYYVGTVGSASTAQIKAYLMDDDG